MFIIIRNNTLIKKCKTRLEVIKWYEENKQDDCYVIKGNSIKDFISKAI